MTYHGYFFGYILSYENNKKMSRQFFLLPTSFEPKFCFMEDCLLVHVAVGSDLSFKTRTIFFCWSYEENMSIYLFLFNFVLYYGQFVLDINMPFLFSFGLFSNKIKDRNLSKKIILILKKILVDKNTKIYQKCSDKSVLILLITN